MQLCRIIYYSLAALHVSSDIFAHYQEHLNCITASGIKHVCRCRLVSWWQQLCRIIYYYLAVVHVSSDIFAHHQEHLNCITASVITHICRCRLVSWYQQLYRIIFYSLTALHVSSDIFAHHQEHLTVLQLLILHTYVAAGWYHGRSATANSGDSVVSRWICQFQWTMQTGCS